jgi:ADP-ribosyl-[dinitrogen reductase] hydrolase
VLNLTIANILTGCENPLHSALEYIEGDAPDELTSALATVPDGVSEAELQTNGYVVTTLQTALSYALTVDTTREAIVKTINRGGDADTIGAIAGAVAGARHGPESLPSAWLDEIAERAELETLAAELLKIS